MAIVAILGFMWQWFKKQKGKKKRGKKSFFPVQRSEITRSCVTILQSSIFIPLDVEFPGKA